MFSTEDNCSLGLDVLFLQATRDGLRGAGNSMSRGVSSPVSVLSEATGLPAAV